MNIIIFLKKTWFLPFCRFLNIRQKQKIYYYFFLLFLLFFISCGINDFMTPNTLSPPYNLKIYPGSDSITIHFSAKNSEEKFDGYNIYISKSATIRSSSISPLKNNNLLPTISQNPMTSEQFFEYTITLFNDLETIQNGTTYFITIKAHDYENFQSLFSEEVSTTPRPEGNATISVGKNFDLSTGNIQTLGNFTFKTQNNTVLLFSNNDYWQDLGYYSSASEQNKAPESGYFPNHTDIPVHLKHIYICKTTTTNFAKIYITNLSENSFSFYWAYQTIAKNKDI